MDFCFVMFCNVLHLIFILHIRSIRIVLGSLANFQDVVLDAFGL